MAERHHVAREGEDAPAGKRPRRSAVRVAGVVLAVVAALAGLFAVGLLGRWLARTIAPVVYDAADGETTRILLVLLGAWAMIPLLALAAIWARATLGAWAAAPLWALTGLDVLLLLGFSPGRNNNGRLSRELSRATDSVLVDGGDVFVGAALAGFVVLVLVTPLVGSWALGGGALPGRSGSGIRAPRLAAGAVAYVAGWVGAGAVVLAVVGPGPDRLGWLDDSAVALRGGDTGVTGGFAVGLEPSVVEVVGCTDAARALRVDDAVPALAGCRRALLVAAAGRYDTAGGARLTSGALTAVVVQVGARHELDQLERSLDGVELVAAGPLPAPPGESVATPAAAAYSLVVHSEDDGDIPLPAEGAGRRPLARALAYVVIGSANGIYLAPPTDR